MKNLAKLVGAFALCSASLLSQASFIASGEIQSLYDSGNKVGSSVDKWYFTVGSDSEILIDVLSWESDEEGRASDDGFPEAVDLNEDGEFTFIDSFIYLFFDDGELSADDLIDFNDDSEETYNDGSLFSADSFLSADLFAGNYILAIGAADPFDGLSIEAAISGTSSNIDFPVSCDVDPFFGCFFQSSDTGDYRVTFTGDVTQQVEVSEPWMLSLFGLGLLILIKRQRR